MRCLPLFALAILVAQTLAAPAGAENFTLDEWNRIAARADRGDPRAQGLRDGYLAGVRDALRFYSKVAKTFPICWPRDHEIDEDLVRGIVGAVRREHPDIAKPEDNFAYVVVLALYDTYPCR